MDIFNKLKFRNLYLDKTLPYSKHSRNSWYTAGFTLVELLVASSMTLIVITIAGVAIAHIMKGDIKSNIESQIQYDFSRLAEFISKEVKTSLVSTIPATDSDRSKIPSTVLSAIPSDAKYILLLKNKDLAAPIIYFTVLRTSSYVTQTWLARETSSNLVLYRWGPTLDSSGNQYTSPDTPTAWGNPVPMGELLSADSVTPSCLDSSWQLIPSSSTQDGFYVCVKPTATGGTTGKRVVLHLASKLKSDRLSQNKNGTDGDVVTYKIDTEIYSRVTN